MLMVTAHCSMLNQLLYVAGSQAGKESSRSQESASADEPDAQLADM